MFKKIEITKEQKEYLNNSNNYKNLTLDQMALDLGFSKTIIGRYFKENNIQRGVKLIWTKEMFDYLKYNYKTKEYKDIAAYINTNLNPNRNVKKHSIEEKLGNEKMYKLYKVRSRNNIKTKPF